MQMSALSHEMSSQRKYELFLFIVHRDVKGTRIYLRTCLPHGTWSPWHFQVVPHQPIWQSLESQIPRWHWQHLQVRRGKSGAGAHSGTALPPPSHQQTQWNLVPQQWWWSLWERGEKLLRCLRKDNARSWPRAMWGPENSCPNRRQKQHSRDLPLLNTETTPLRSARIHLVSGNIPRDSSTISSKKSWLSKPRDVLKLAQHSEHPGTWRFSFVLFWEKKDLNSPLKEKWLLPKAG